MLDKPYKQQLELNFPDRVFRFHVPKSRFGVLLQQRHIKASRAIYIRTPIFARN